jgi:predicted TIM-barrel fold metal-dependent hydrolase
MGNRSLELEDHIYPGFLRYCLGIHSEELEPANLKRAVELTELHLRRETCAGLKIYAGYTRRDLCDPAYFPFYELAGRYGKPVAVHTGVTASSNALLRYSHPLQLDEAAVAFPKVNFVMCHFGNPWLADAAAVLEKNGNVAADISGLLVGRVDIENLVNTQSGYFEQLRTWISYVDDYDKFLYGTDWPLTRFDGYINLTERLIPEKYLEAVFYGNASRVYGGLL